MATLTKLVYHMVHLLVSLLIASNTQEAITITNPVQTALKHFFTFYYSYLSAGICAKRVSV
jgi:hypothetical protein